MVFFCILAQWEANKFPNWTSLGFIYFFSLHVYLHLLVNYKCVMVTWWQRYYLAITYLCFPLEQFGIVIRLCIALSQNTKRLFLKYLKLRILNSQIIEYGQNKIRLTPSWQARTEFIVLMWLPKECAPWRGWKSFGRHASQRLAHP